MESDGDHFLAYYLPKEDETADTFKQKRKDGEEVQVQMVWMTNFIIMGLTCSFLRMKENRLLARARL